MLSNGSPHTYPYYIVQEVEHTTLLLWGDLLPPIRLGVISMAENSPLLSFCKLGTWVTELPAISFPPRKTKALETALGASMKYPYTTY
jgi:hypothetical protein